MADGVAITAGSGTTIATDDAGAAGHVQIVKLAIAADGSATVVPGDATNGLDVDVTRVGGTVTTKHAGTTGAQTNVASTTTPNTTLLAADANRVGATIYNDSTAVLFVLLGAGTESATVYTLQIAAGGYYEVPEAFVAMRISGHWATANGSARITAAT
jgi:hypothetical protein